MRVGIDAMQLWGEWTGVGRATWELARRFSAEGSGHEFALYASRGFPRALADELARPHFRVRRAWFHARRRTLRIFWQQLRFASRAMRDGVQVIHAPAYVMPVMSPLPVVVTVHDAIAAKHPALVTRASRAHLDRFLPKTLERAKLVTVPSRAVARDLEKLHGVPRSKVRVIPFGVGPEFRPARDDDERAGIRRALGVERPYVLFVGRVEPKKNVGSVLGVFYAAMMSANLEHALVLAGPGTKGRGVARLIDELGIAERTRAMGYVPDERMPLLCRGADLLLMPSAAEGFGFPVLEAMASGTPCLISEDPALAELAGGAAVQAPAGRLDLLRPALERALTDSALRGRLRREGLERARAFTWERTAELMLDAYAEAREMHERG